LTETYRRLFLRWEVVRGWIPALAFAGVAVLVELFYFSYMTARGLADKQVALPVGPWTLPVSIALFLSLGNAVLLLTLWMSVFENIAYVKAGPDKQVRRILYPLRMLRVATLVLVPFTIVLFLPHVVVSLGFVRFADSATTAIPQLRQAVIDFYNWTFGISRIDASTRFILSQVSAALVTVAIGALQVWRARGTRNLMLLLRRRR
jgi:hypothetical protein